MAEASDTPSAPADQREKSPTHDLLKRASVRLTDARDTADRLSRLARCAEHLGLLYRDYCEAEPRAAENMWTMADELADRADLLCNQIANALESVDEALQ